MAQRSHVPKFGNWDSDNVPYTAYFENARKEKGSGVKMNPNDPEENPDAFMFGGGGIRMDGVSTDKPTSVENYQIEGHKPNHQRNISDHQKSVGLKSMTSESGSSDKSNSDYSRQKSNHRRTRSDRKKSLTESSNVFYPPSPGPNRLRAGNNQADDISFRSASVPMFGAWDERDPKSGEGFTVIFNKVKEEKQIAASKFPAVPTQPSDQSNGQKNDTRSKRCCCLF